MNDVKFIMFGQTRIQLIVYFLLAPTISHANPNDTGIHVKAIYSIEILWMAEGLSHSHFIGKFGFGMTRAGMRSMKIAGLLLEHYDYINESIDRYFGIFSFFLKYFNHICVEQQFESSF